MYIPNVPKLYFIFQNYPKSDISALSSIPYTSVVFSTLLCSGIKMLIFLFIFKFRLHLSWQSLDWKFSTLSTSHFRIPNIPMHSVSDYLILGIQFVSVQVTRKLISTSYVCSKLMDSDGLLHILQPSCSLADRFFFNLLWEGHSPISQFSSLVNNYSRKCAKSL